MVRFPRIRLASLGGALVCCFLAVPADSRDPAAPSSRADRLVPGDASVLASLDLRQTLATPLVRKYALEELGRVLTRDDRVVKVLRLAGLDPLKDVDTLAFAASGDISNPRLLAVIRGRFDPAKVHAAATDYARQNPDKLKALQEGDRVVYQVQAEKTVFGAFADHGTFVLSPSKEVLLETVRQAGGAPGQLSPEMQKAVDRLGGRECAWVAAVITDQMKQALQKQDPDLAVLASSLASITGKLELTDSLQLVVVIHAANPGAAALVAKKLDELMELLKCLAPGKDAVGRVTKEALSSIKVVADKNDVRVTLQLTEAMIQKATQKER
jgi:hypothetical protein